MSSRIERGELVFEVEGQEPKRWSLPDRDDTEKIRSLRLEAVQFAATQGATEGQQAAVRRTLWKEGYGSGRRRTAKTTAV